MSNLVDTLLVQSHSIFLLLSLYLSARKISKKISTYSIELTAIFVTIIIISLISLIFQIILMLDHNFFYTFENYLKKIFVSLAYLITAFFLYKEKLNFSEFKAQYRKNSYLISLFVIIFFLCSIGVVSDADSLIYHSKISKVILSGHEVNYFHDNLHFILIGTFEIFNLLPEIMGITNFNTLINLLFLINIIIYINKKFSNKIYNKDLFLLLIISAPIITMIITPQKAFFAPLIVQFMCLMFFLFNKKPSKKDLAICIAALILTTVFKLNFIISGGIILIACLLKQKNLTFTLKVSFLVTLILIIPNLFFKFYHFGSPLPPILSQYLNGELNMYSSFAQELKNWRGVNTFIFPLNIFLSSSLSEAHNTLGVGLISFLFIKKYNSKNRNILLFVLFSIVISNIIFVQQTTRFYYLSYLVSLLIILESNLKYSLYLKKIIFLQYLFTIVALALLVPVSISTTFIDNKDDKYKEKFIFRYAVNKKINELIGENNYIITDLTNYYSSNFEIVTAALRVISNTKELDKYKKHLNDSDVKYMLVSGSPIDEIDNWHNGNYFVNNFFPECFKDLVSKFSIERATRKKVIFNKLEYIDYYLYKKKDNCRF